MKYRAEIWINNGSASFWKESPNKEKLLKESMALIRECHAPYPDCTSSVTIYQGDRMIRDHFLTGDKTYFKRFYGKRIPRNHSNTSR